MRRNDKHLISEKTPTKERNREHLGLFAKIGRALMVPVAVLPAAAILMGIGYWIDPNGWGAEALWLRF